MNANDSLERGIADFYESEAPPRAPDWLLATALESIDTTPQRRVLIRVPWRSPRMNSLAKVAIAAVVVIAVGAVGWNLFGPRAPSGVGGQSTASPAPSPSTTPDPSAPPPLSETFTSTMYGISLSYPAGWVVAPGTEPWLPTSTMNFGSPVGDQIYDGSLRDHLFLAVASQPLGGTAGETWTTDFLSDPENDCPAGGSEPITVDGANGRICGSLVALSAGDRGYLIRLYTSGDEPWLDTYYDQAWFRSVLATVKLHPEDAVDTPTSPSASPS